MNALLAKDIASVKKQAALIICAVAVLAACLIPVEELKAWGAVIAVLIAAAEPFTAVFDDRSGFEKYSATMPISRTAYAVEKYVFSALLALAGALVCFLIWLPAKGFSLYLLEYCGAVLFGAVIFDCIYIPVSFKFDASATVKCCAASSAVAAVAAAVFGFADTLWIPVTVLDAIPYTVIALGVVAAAVSIPISVSLLKKKEYRL